MPVTCSSSPVSTFLHTESEQMRFSENFDACDNEEGPYKSDLLHDQGKYLHVSYCIGLNCAV